VLVGWQASPSGVLTFPGFDKPWFLTEGKLAVVLIIPSSWGSQLIGNFHHHHQSHQAIFLAPLPGIEEEEAPTSTTHSHVNLAPSK
jgi:hypothetical protein